MDITNMLHFTLQHENTHTQTGNLSRSFLHVVSPLETKTEHSFLHLVHSSPKSIEHLLSVADDVYPFPPVFIEVPCLSL